MAQKTLAQLQASEGAVGGGRRRIFWFGIAVVAVVAAAVFFISHYTASKAESDFENSLRSEMKDVSGGCIGKMNEWLQSGFEETIRFANSPLVVEFARNVEALGGNLGEAMAGNTYASAKLDVAFLQLQLNNFASYSKFDFASIVNNSGEMYLNTDPAVQSLNSRQREAVNDVVQNGRAVWSNVRQGSGGRLYFELYVPVLDGSIGESSPTVAVLYVTQNVAPKLRELTALQGYDVAMLQREGAGLQRIDVASDSLREIADFKAATGGVIPFGERNSAIGGQKVYSQGARLDSIDVWVVIERSYTESREKLDLMIRDNYLFSALLSILLVLLVGVLWYWGISQERSQSLNKVQKLFSVIDEQKHLLDSINSAIAEPISLTDANGNYLYVNQAFADAFGRDVDNIIGLDTAAVCGFDTARRLSSSDQHVLMSGEKVTTSEIIWLQSRRHFFQISKAPLRDADSQSITGIVSVFRDVTKLMEAEEHSHRMVQQTIDALVSIIEQTDPFLGGHSRIMGEVAKLISKGLNLSEKDSATIEAGATLSQIGKMFVPREVLAKPGVLTPEEKKVMERHVEHTMNALGKIEFDLPVLEGISQMNERVDGKGYPAGLKGEEISIYGKVLAVANAFTAMARPRSYRPAMDVKTVLDTLQKQAGSSYDAHVLEVLRSVLDTPAGEQVVAKAAKSTPV